MWRKIDYLQLQVNLREFASHFIGLCHTTEEVEIMLKEGIGLVGTGAKQKYPRLILAVEFDQKQVRFTINCPWNLHISINYNYL